MTKQGVVGVFIDAFGKAIRATENPEPPPYWKWYPRGENDYQGYVDEEGNPVENLHRGPTRSTKGHYPLTEDEKRQLCDELVERVANTRLAKSINKTYEEICELSPNELYEFYWDEIHKIEQARIAGFLQDLGEEEEKRKQKIRDSLPDHLRIAADAIDKLMEGHGYTFEQALHIYSEIYQDQDKSIES